MKRFHLSKTRNYLSILFSAVVFAFKASEDSRLVAKSPTKKDCALLFTPSLFVAYKSSEQRDSSSKKRSNLIPSAIKIYQQDSPEYGEAIYMTNISGPQRKDSCCQITFLNQAPEIVSCYVSSYGFVVYQDPNTHRSYVRCLDPMYEKYLEERTEKKPVWMSQETMSRLKRDETMSRPHWLALKAYEVLIAAKNSK